MDKKKLIISRKQFNHINEVEQTNVNLTANIGSGGVPKMNQILDTPEMRTAVQKTGMDPMFIPQTYKGPQASPTVQIQADGAGNVTSVPAGTPPDAALVVKNTSGSSSADGTIQESYTKRAVEKMRIAKIMENGTRFTKKQINEDINNGKVLSEEDRDAVIEYCRKNEFIARIIKPEPLFGKDTVCANVSRLRNLFLSDLYNPNTKMALDDSASLPHNVDEGALPIHVWVYDENNALKEEYVIFMER